MLTIYNCIFLLIHFNLTCLHTPLLNLQECKNVKNHEVSSNKFAFLANQKNELLENYAMLLKIIRQENIFWTRGKDFISFLLQFYSYVLRAYGPAVVQSYNPKVLYVTRNEIITPHGTYIHIREQAHLKTSPLQEH